MAMILSVVGGIVSAMGAMQAAQAQAAAAKYNAKIAERNKRAVLAQTSSTIADQQLHNRRVLGAMRAAYGANGLEMTGSPLDVMYDTAFEQSFDISKIKYQGKMKAQGYEEQATLFKMEASAAQAAGTIGAASAILGGFSNAISSAPSGGAGYSLAAA